MNLEVIPTVLVLISIACVSLIFRSSSFKKKIKTWVEEVKKDSKTRKLHELAYDIHHNRDPALKEDLQEMGIDVKELVPEGIDEEGYDAEGTPVLTQRNLGVQITQGIAKEVKDEMLKHPFVQKSLNALRDLKALHETGVAQDLAKSVKERYKEKYKDYREETRMTDQELAQALLAMETPKSKGAKLTLENLMWVQRYLQVYAGDHPQYSEVIKEVRARIYRLNSERKVARATQDDSSPQSEMHTDAESLEYTGEPDVTTKMKQLKDMLVQGLISEEEFDRKKKEILARL